MSVSARWLPTAGPSCKFDLWVHQTRITTCIVTQPGWNFFYHPTDGTRLNRPRHCSICASRAQKLYSARSFSWKKTELPAIRFNRRTSRTAVRLANHYTTATRSGHNAVNSLRWISATVDCIFHITHVFTSGAILNPCSQTHNTRPIRRERDITIGYARRT